jgi:hypothetical protein
MSLIQTCKCEECDMQKSFANHWVMVFERSGNLVILPKWDEKLLRRTRHFCGRAHASRFVERWIASAVSPAVTESGSESDSQKLAQSLGVSQAFLDAEDEAIAAELAARYR